MYKLKRLTQGASVAVLSAASLAAQPAQPDRAVKQQDAVAAMRESIAKQRNSIQKQTRQPAAAEGFFMLPPPSSMGATFARPIQASVDDCEPLSDSEVAPIVKDAAQREDVDEKLLRSVIRQESGFRPCAVSPKGAQGMMQIMPATADQFGLANPFDAAQNIDTGAKLLKQLLVRYNGDLPKALGAYNAGPARVDAADGVPAIRETQDYVKQILSTLSVKQ